MLGDLRLRRRVNDSKLWADYDIRDSGISLWVAEAHGYEAGAVDDVLDLEFGGGFQETLNCCLESGLVFEEDERDVIGRDPGDLDAGGRDDERRVNFAE